MPCTCFSLCAQIALAMFQACNRYMSYKDLFPQCYCPRRIYPAVWRRDMWSQGMVRSTGTPNRHSHGMMEAIQPDHPLVVTGVHLATCQETYAGVSLWYRSGLSMAENRLESAWKREPCLCVCCDDEEHCAFIFHTSSANQTWWVLYKLPFNSSPVYQDINAGIKDMYNKSLVQS